MTKTKNTIVAVTMITVLIWLIQLLRINAFSNELPSASIYSAQGYTDTVDLFLQHDWLRYDPNNGKIVPNIPVASPTSLEEGRKLSAAERFFRESYLEQDIAAFNEDDERTVFRIENGRILSLNPNLHNIVMPFTELRFWRGKLTYRPEPVRKAALLGKQVSIELLGPQSNLRDLHDVPRISVPREGSAGSFRRVDGDAVNIFSENGEYFFGKAHALGSSIVFNHRGSESAGPALQISISGEDVKQGNRSRMDSGDLLRLSWPDSRRPDPYSLLWASVSEDATEISSYRWVSGRWRRTPASVQPRLAQNVAAAIDSALRRRADDGTYEVLQGPRVDGFDLALSLSRKIQQEVQELLLDESRELLAREGRPFRSAVTVMDASTGELLALASFPTEGDLNDVTNGSSSRRRLLRNHNLSRRPVGSVAKVLLATAILGSAPELHSLEIPEYAGGESDRLLGIELSPPLKDHAVWGGDDQRVDFDEFIERSSNRYAAVLLTLATGIDQKNEWISPLSPSEDLPSRLTLQEQFWLGGELFVRRPDLGIPLQVGNQPDTVRVGQITTLEFTPHARRLQEYFDVDITRSTPAKELGRKRPPEDGDDLINTRMWLPVLNHFYPRTGIPYDHTFFGVSPERENLTYNLIGRYRTEYLSVILGGASSTWTNVKLAEAFSRIVTGNQIEATLINQLINNGVPIPPRRDSVGAAAIPAEVRQKMADAMIRVAGPAGTASDLSGLLRQLDGSLRSRNQALGFFSKTGSPTNLIFPPHPTTKAVNELIRIGALTLDIDDNIVYRQAGVVRSSGALGRQENPALIALSSHEGDRAILDQHQVDPQQVVSACATYNESPVMERELFEVSEGKLVRMLRGRRVETIGAAFVFTIGIYDQNAVMEEGSTNSVRRIDVVTHKPERALSVAVLIETQGNSVEVAVPFSKKLIANVLWDALNDGW